MTTTKISLSSSVVRIYGLSCLRKATEASRFENLLGKAKMDWVILPNKDALLSSPVGSGLNELNSRCNVSDGPSTVEIIQLPLIKTKQKFVILFMVHSNYQKKVFFKSYLILCKFYGLHFLGLNQQ